VPATDDISDADAWKRMYNQVRHYVSGARYHRHRVYENGRSRFVRTPLPEHVHKAFGIYRTLDNAGQQGAIVMRLPDELRNNDQRPDFAAE
jgi:hypothetical protein